MTQKELFASGHRGCPGCGAAMATRMMLRATGDDVIVVSPTGCLETFTSMYGESCWEVPWFHGLFENAGAIASGVEAALKMQGRTDTKVVAIGGDGGTFDIGIGALSGMLERGHNVTYICSDHEAYLNTGVQRSSATTPYASTTTSPAGSHSMGKTRPKKNLAAIALAHDVPYVATASIAYPQDFMNKVKKSLTFQGSRFIHVHAPCPIGWGFDTALTVEVGRLAVETGLMPIWEAEYGEITKVRKIREVKPIEEYLKVQRRFRHLFASDAGKKELAALQELCNKNIEKMGLAGERKVTTDVS